MVFEVVFLLVFSNSTISRTVLLIPAIRTMKADDLGRDGGYARCKYRNPNISSLRPSPISHPTLPDSTSQFTSFIPLQQRQVTPNRIRISVSNKPFQSKLKKFTLFNIGRVVTLSYNSRVEELTPTQKTNISMDADGSLRAFFLDEEAFHHVFITSSSPDLSLGDCMPTLSICS